MSTTAFHIIQLVRSLPAAEQQAIRDALSKTHIRTALPNAGQDTFAPEDYEGLPDDDPFFKITEQVEAERHSRVGPTLPDLD